MSIPIWLPVLVIVFGMVCKGVSLYQRFVKKNESKANTWLAVGLTCTVVGLSAVFLSM